MSEPITKSDVARAEEAVLRFWREQDIFAKSLKQREGSEPYIFYDGPPFATGTPHYGHILASAIKDAVPRYQTMRGRYVARRWGWDTHGLPIENIVEKKLGISGKKEIEALGVEVFNRTAREQVLTYVAEWKKTVERMGRWVDFDGAYKTMDNDYIESVWSAFGKLYDLGLVYEGTRVLPYCPRCETPVAQSEIAMDNSYQDISDLSVYVTIKLVGGTSLVVWTTTPWTLPGNTAIGINPRLTYVEVEYFTPTFVRHLILAKDRLEILGPEDGGLTGHDSWEVLREVPASELIGVSYQPPFDYFQGKDFPDKDRAWKIYAADYVTADQGTGIVHLAPAFGEEDMALAKQEQIPALWHVDATGQFTADVTDLSGQAIKPKDDHQRADVEIIKLLAAKGTLLKKEKIVHSYPHCFRCETPLYYYAIPAWFIKIQDKKKRLAELNEDIHWVPGHLKHGRFGMGMEGAPDWNISRNRFWASPLPIWKCKSSHITIVDSIAKLEKLAGRVPDDLHRPFIDEVTFACPDCRETATRIPEVFDCWFESGSMPFAADHYLFGETENPPANFPADFVAEYIAQTRTWFYYMHVLGTLLFDGAPFEHVVTTGNVLAADGAKMSKSKQNYPDPGVVFEQYGVDAVRYYLLASPLMKAEDLNFSEQGVDEVFKKVILRLKNVHAFYLLYPNNQPNLDEPKSQHVLDRWIIARLNELVGLVTDSMERYEIESALRPIETFVDDLSVWYVRRSRERMKQQAGEQGSQTLRLVLRELAKVMAPFTPFVAEEVYRSVKGSGDPESVHLTDWPEPTEVDAPLIGAMADVRALVSAGLEARASAAIKVRQPLSGATVTARALEPELEALLQDELNVKSLHYRSGDGPAVTLETELDDELKAEGLVREVIRTIQQLRKSSQLQIDQTATVILTGEHRLRQSIIDLQSDIEGQTRTKIVWDGHVGKNPTNVEGLTVSLHP